MRGFSPFAFYASAYAGLPRTVWLIAMATLVNRAGTMVLPFLALYLTADLKLDAVTAGRILSLYGAGALLGSWLGGWLADRVGALGVLTMSFTGGGLILVVYPTLTDPVTLGAVTLLLACVADAHRPAMMVAVVGACAPELQARGLALLRTAINLGMAAGPAIGGVLATIRYELLFWVNAVALWASAALVGVSLARRRRHGATTGSERPERSPRRSPWRDGPFLAFLVLVVLMAALFLQILGTWPLYMREGYDLNEAFIGGLMALNALFLVTVEMPAVKAVERFPPLYVAGIGTACIGLGFGLLPLGHTLAFAIVSLLVWTVGEMLAFPLTNAVAGRRAPEGSRGAYMGAYTMAFAVAFIVAPTAGMSLYDYAGPAWLWGCTAVMGVLVGVGFIQVGRRLEAGAVHSD